MSQKHTKSSFQKLLLQWNSTGNTRIMPWKGEKNPYFIWLSEIILQQTRVEQGLSYYNRFISTFPKIEDLANANDDEVFKLWEGLGYYSRCRNLLHTARFIAFEMKGKFPSDHASILKLKGVGPYTAAAISSFAFNEPRAVLDGNVYRVLSRYFGISTPIDSTKGKKEFGNLALLLLDKKEPATYNQAIMDFGATVCAPKPNCNLCLINKSCAAFNTGRQLSLPVKEKKTARSNRYFQYVIIQSDNNVLVRQRENRDIWQGLYEFILHESDGPVSEEKFTSSGKFRNLAGKDYKILSRQKYRQVLSHQLVESLVISIEAENLPELDGYLKIPLSHIRNLPFPGILQQPVRKLSGN